MYSFAIAKLNGLYRPHWHAALAEASNMLQLQSNEWYAGILYTFAHIANVLDTVSWSFASSEWRWGICSTWLNRSICTRSQSLQLIYSLNDPNANENGTKKVCHLSAYDHHSHWKQFKSRFPVKHYLNWSNSKNCCHKKRKKNVFYYWHSAFLTPKPLAHTSARIHQGKKIKRQDRCQKI